MHVRLRARRLAPWQENRNFRSTSHDYNRPFTRPQPVSGARALDAGRPAVYFDGPGGTQVPQGVVDAMSRYLIQANANHGGAFRTSRDSDAILAAAHEAMADLLNAPSAREIVFGPNMTSLTFTLSRAIGRELAPGDEVIVTRLDHDANRAPWLALAERGVTVHEIDFDPVDCTLRLDDLAARLNERTKVVAIGYASNAVGTVNPIAKIAEMVHSVGAWLWVDAVHYAPHGPIDVQALDCDFLVCSPYKFFGPHSGTSGGVTICLSDCGRTKCGRPATCRPTSSRPARRPTKLRPACWQRSNTWRRWARSSDRALPHRFPGFTGRRLALKQAMAAIQAYERPLFERFVTGLLEIPGLSFYGIRDFSRFDQRTPTAAFRLEGRSPDEVAERLAQRGIYVWSGNFYAVAVTERLGLEASGGVVRAGLAHYNTQEEVDYCLACLREIVAH